MNVAQWLNAIDLGQYEALFREHEIDANVLPDLVEADLEKIGVPLGHRKRLMRAIAALSAGGTPPSAAKPTSAQPSPSPPTSGAEAERRPITVMFCDLAGSTSLAAKLDAEDWRNLVNAYLDEASRAVTALGGHVLKKLGDGLMAVFGYPQAQNDAERAVRAALAIQRALGDLNARNAAKGAPALCGAHRPRHGAGRGRRERRSVRRNAECRGAGAGAAEPGMVVVTASRAAADGRAFRRRGHAAHAPQGRAGARDPLPHRAGERRPARGRARFSHPARRAQGRTRPVHRRWSRALGRRPAPLRSSANPASASRVWSRSSAQHLRRRRTPGSNCRRRSYCKIRRCTRSPNGAASASARTCPPNSAWPTSRILWV